MALFVPLGVPAFDGTEEKDKISFKQVIKRGNAEKALIQIRNGSDVFYEKEITDASFLTEGAHTHYWDGFDNHDVLDTAFLTNAKNLNILSKIWYNGGETTFKTTPFKIRYDEVDWVDVKIDKVSSRIDITIRVNLTDGGEFGTEKDCIDYQQYPGTKVTRRCPWDKIPASEITSSKPLIKSRKRSFEELKEMVLEGINTYWSRRYSNTQGTMINDENWEVIVTAVNTDDSKISLDDIPLIYNTNNAWSRSGNPGCSHFGDGNKLDEWAKVLPDGVIQRISYNIHHIKYSDGWFYDTLSEADEEFKGTAAHEIGHEILQAFAGTVYSWQHKGTSYYLPQKKKPTGEESFKQEYLYRDFMEDTKGENFPTGKDEIDLMKYYHGTKPSDFYGRRVAHEKDIQGLLWLTKLKI